MSAGPTRIAPFLAVSVALHAAAFAVMGPERLSIAPAPAGRQGQTISVHLVAAGRAAAPARPEPAGDAVPAAAEQSEPRAQPAAEEAGGSAPEPERHAAKPDDAQTRPERKRSAEARPREGRPAEEQSQQESRRIPAGAGARDDGTAAAVARDSEQEEPGAAERPGENEIAKPPATPTHSREATANAATPGPRSRPVRKHTAPAQTQERHLADARSRSAQPAGGDDGNAPRSVSAEQVRSEISAELAKHFRYPRLARSHGWEGRVVLGFRVRPDGRITDIEVVESSGRTILDRAAVEALRQVRRVPSLAEHATGEPIALRMPVSYRLQSA